MEIRSASSVRTAYRHDLLGLRKGSFPGTEETSYAERCVTGEVRVRRRIDYAAHCQGDRAVLSLESADRGG